MLAFKFDGLVELSARIMEAAGIGVMLVGTVVAVVLLVLPGYRAASPHRNAFRQFRMHLGRGILLGLEFLVAADIIRTVSEIPTLERVFVLAIIVLIRTFLSFALQAELEGRWPWQQKESSKG